MAQQNSNFALTYIRTKNCNRTERSEPHLNVQQKKKLIEGCGGFILFSEEKADRGGCGCFILFHSNETSQVILIQPHIAVFVRLKTASCNSYAKYSVNILFVWLL